jgi:ribonuclease P/MRP protein subunit POP5
MRIAPARVRSNSDRWLQQHNLLNTMVRFKNRYLLMEVIWKDGRVDDGLAEANIQTALRESLAANFGDYGIGMSLQSLQVKYYNPLTSHLIVRGGREQLKQVRSVPFNLQPPRKHDSRIECPL